MAADMFKCHVCRFHIEHAKSTLLRFFAGICVELLGTIVGVIAGTNRILESLRSLSRASHFNIRSSSDGYLDRND